VQEAPTVTMPSWPNYLNISTWRAGQREEFLNNSSSQKALIFQDTPGIGPAAARALVKHDLHVIVTGRNSEPGRHAQAENPKSEVSIT
jgi:hypothetical protein